MSHVDREIASQPDAITRSGTTTEVLSALARVPENTPIVALTGDLSTPVVDAADPLVDLVRAQRLAVALAGRRGLDPDRPRNLTRSIVLADS